MLDTSSTEVSYPHIIKKELKNMLVFLSLIRDGGWEQETEIGQHYTLRGDTGDTYVPKTAEEVMTFWSKRKYQADDPLVVCKAAKWQP